MLKRLAVAATAALLAPAPVAHAATVGGGCALAAFAEGFVTGSRNTYVGILGGFAAFDDPDTHIVRCYVRADGSEIASLGARSGAALAGDAWEVTFNADDDALVEVCLEIDYWWETPTCQEATWLPGAPPNPAPVVYDYLEDVDDAADPLVCPVLASLSPGVPGFVDITPDGDTSILERSGAVWDCPPEGDAVPPRVSAYVGTVTYAG